MTDRGPIHEPALRASDEERVRIGACGMLKRDVSDPPKQPLASRHMPNQLVHVFTKTVNPFTRL